MSENFESTIPKPLMAWPSAMAGTIVCNHLVACLIALRPGMPTADVMWMSSVCWFQYLHRRMPRRTTRKPNIVVPSSLCKKVHVVAPIRKRRQSSHHVARPPGLAPDI
jgi:hypothetical protein